MEPLPIRLDDHDLLALKRATAMAFLARFYPNSPGYYREAGDALVKLRQGKTRDRFAQIVREFCGLSSRRCYELMELAAGKKTPAGMRAAASARMRKHRQKKGLARIDGGTSPSPTHQSCRSRA
jgi:hypothetical protein